MLEQLLGCRSPTYDQLIDPSANPRVVFEYVKHLSSSGDLQKYMIWGDERQLVAKLIELHGEKPENATLTARMYARLGYGADVNDAIYNYQQATVTTNVVPCVAFLPKQTSSVATPSTPDCAQAIEGFIKSIEYGPSNSSALQDVLKLLALWTRHADNEEGLAVLEKRVFDIRTSLWQLVIPQLIARLDTGSNASCQLVASLLEVLAKDHAVTHLPPPRLHCLYHSPDASNGRFIFSAVWKKISNWSPKAAWSLRNYFDWHR